MIPSMHSQPGRGSFTGGGTCSHICHQITTTSRKLRIRVLFYAVACANTFSFQLYCFCFGMGKELF